MLQLTLSQLLSPLLLDSPVLDSEQGLQLTLFWLFDKSPPLPLLLLLDSPPMLLLLSKLVRLLVFLLVVVLVLALLT